MYCISALLKPSPDKLAVRHGKVKKKKAWCRLKPGPCHSRPCQRMNHYKKKIFLKKKRRRRKLKPGVQKGNLERDESSLSLTSLDPDDFPWAFFLCLPTSAQLACGIPPLSSSGAETSTQNGKTVWEARSWGWLETDAGLVSGRAASGPR